MKEMSLFVLVLRVWGAVCWVLGLWCFGRMLSADPGGGESARAAIVITSFYQTISCVVCGLLFWWMGEVCLLLGDISQKLGGGERPRVLPSDKQKRLDEAKRKMGL